MGAKSLFILLISHAEMAAWLVVEPADELAAQISPMPLENTIKSVE